MLDDPNSEAWGMYDGQCAGCDVYGRVNDLGLCIECADKLDRDLVRERDWERSAAACLLSDADRETLRDQIIREHGKALELILPANKSRPKKRHRRSAANTRKPPA